MIWGARRIARVGAVCTAAAVLTAHAWSPPSGRGLLAQDSQDIEQRPPFRAGTTVVSVDVYPRRDGQVVEGLTADAFQVLEDGALQEVTSFEFIRHIGNTADAERRDPNTAADSLRQAADPRNRVFVVYIDQQHMTQGWRAGALVMDFLRRVIGPSDLFGVMTPDTPASQLTFGRALGGIERGFDDAWAWQADRRHPRTPIEERIYKCSLLLGDSSMRIVDRFRDDQMFSHLENVVLRLGDLRDERKHVLFIGESWVPEGPQPSLAAGAQQQGGRTLPRPGSRPENPLSGPATEPGSSERLWCVGQVMRLADLDFKQRFVDLLAAAVRANVSFYPVDLGGLATSLAMADASRRFVSATAPTLGGLNTFRTMAEQTDGLAIADTNDLAGGVRRIIESVAAYYRLGYASTNPAADGRFRRIEVKVDEPGLSVSARRGYFAHTPDMRASALVAGAAPAPGPSPIDEALGLLSRVRPDADLLAYGAASPTGLHVVAEIASRTSQRADWQSGATVRVVASSADTGAAIEGSGRIDPARRAMLVALPPDPGDRGPWHVSVRVTNAGGDVIDAGIDVPAPVDRMLGFPLAFRGGASARSSIHPVADFTWRRSERLHVEWPVSDPLAAREGRLLDRRGAPLPLAPTVTAGTSDRGSVLTVDLVLASLAEGEYLLELAPTADPVSDRQLFAFRVTR